MNAMLRAIIFDFNGVLVNDEPLHFKLFQRVLAEHGIVLDEADYYRRYLGMDDRGCFQSAFADRGRRLEESLLRMLVERKAAYYQERIVDDLATFPGADRLVPALAERYPLAIASGALRSEIEAILERIELKRFFQVIVSAEDVARGKPEPEIFLKALAGLNRERPPTATIAPAECLVIEDSKEGILGAQRAGMKCIAVAHSYPAAQLGDADAVFEKLAEINPRLAEEMFS
jgi:HAD superfamily hydrolase (TIGR01509 family)